MDMFARCVAASGYKIFITPRCPHCTRQTALFGDNSKHLDIVDCDKDEEACDVHNVVGVPTWIQFDMRTNPTKEVNRVRGFKSLEQLSQLTGCSLGQNSTKQ